jgi:hypothetical protein
MRGIPDPPQHANPVPDNVIETEPVLGAFVFMVDIFGAPYEAAFDIRERREFTLLETNASKDRPEPRPRLQLMFESEIHIECLDALPPMTSIMLMEKGPIFTPIAVIVQLPVVASRFEPNKDKDGTSNVSASEKLPK